MPVRIVSRCDEGCFSDCLGNASPIAALAALPGDIIYLEQDLTFTKPVRPGDTVTAIVEVIQNLGDDRIRVETIAETDDVVLEGEAVVLSVPHDVE